MKKYNLNINCNIEVNLFKFLNTKIYCDNNGIKGFACYKDMKLPVHWKDIVPEYYKINVTIGHLHQVKILDLTFENEVRITRGKYIQLSKLGLRSRGKILPQQFAIAATNCRGKFLLFNKLE